MYKFDTLYIHIYFVYKKKLIKNMNITIQYINIHMKKRKKKNNERAFALKHNIIKHTKLIKLPIKNNIKFKKSNLDTINCNYFDDNNLIKDDTYFNLQSDDLINGRKIEHVLIKTHRILLFPTPKQKEYLIKWMNSWIDIYNKGCFYY